MFAQLILRPDFCHDARNLRVVNSGPTPAARRSSVCNNGYNAHPPMPRHVVIAESAPRGT
eukprot:1002731-Amphidinium_carterae.1